MQRKLLASDPNTSSTGMISAAKLVGAACQMLCEAANDYLSGTASEERLISSAKAVSYGTRALVFAARAKSTVLGVAGAGLITKINASERKIKVATENLLQCANEARNVKPKEAFDKHEDESDNLGFVNSVRQEIQAREAIAMKEKELEQARMTLNRKRRSWLEGGFLLILASTGVRRANRW